MLRVRHIVEYLIVLVLDVDVVAVLLDLVVCFVLHYHVVVIELVLPLMLIL